MCSAAIVPAQELFHFQGLLLKPVCVHAFVENLQRLINVKASMNTRQQKLNKQTMEEVASMVAPELLSNDAFKAIIEKSVLKAIEKKIENVHTILEKLDSRCFDMEQTVDKLTQENTTLKQKITTLEDEKQKIQASINDMEQYSRRNNIRIFGIKENQRENPTEIVQQLAKEKLAIDLDENCIDRCHRVGKTLPGASNRSILVKFTSYQYKRKIIQARRKLKSTGIVIKEDLTQTNNKLLALTQKHETVANCWTLDGRIIALTKTSDQQELKVTINSTSDLLKL